MSWGYVAGAAITVVGGALNKPDTPDAPAPETLASTSNTGDSYITTGDKDFSYNVGLGANVGKTVSSVTESVANANPASVLLIGGLAIVATAALKK